MQERLTLSDAGPATYCPFKAPSLHTLPAGGNQALNVRRFEQRPGMALAYASIQPAAPHCAVDWPGRSHLQILFVSKGEIEFALEGRENLKCVAGEWTLFKYASLSLQAICKTPCNLHWLEFDQQATASLTGFSDTVAPQLLDPHQVSFQKSLASGRLLALGNELGQIEGSDTRERLMIESKTLEWLAILLDQPAFSPCRAIVPQRASRDELALASAARILEDRLHEDHSIAQLSREVHLNEFKLKRGFKEKYKTTVFGFLRQKRMEKARTLLQDGALSVIEVANTVGYSNPSHFARAFKDAFGVNPSLFGAERALR